MKQLLALLAAVAIAALFATLLSRPDSVRSEGERVATPADLVRVEEIRVQLEIALDLYKLEHGRYPNSLDDLVKGSRRHPNGFVQAVPSDPWGAPLRYLRVDRSYRLSSDGPDGRAGSKDDIPFESP